MRKMATIQIIRDITRPEEAGRLIKDKAAIEPKSKKLVTFICTEK